MSERSYVAKKWNFTWHVWSNYQIMYHFSEKCFTTSVYSFSTRDQQTCVKIQLPVTDFQSTSIKRLTLTATTKVTIFADGDYVGKTEHWDYPYVVDLSATTRVWPCYLAADLEFSVSLKIVSKLKTNIIQKLCQYVIHRCWQWKCSTTLRWPSACWRRWTMTKSSPTRHGDAALCSLSTGPVLTLTTQPGSQPQRYKVWSTWNWHCTLPVALAVNLDSTSLDWSFNLKYKNIVKYKKKWVPKKALDSDVTSRYPQSLREIGNLHDSFILVCA